MKVLVINCGSSSLKYQLFDMESETVLAKGMVEKIGLAQSLLSHSVAGKEKYEEETPVKNHNQALSLVLRALLHEEHGAIGALSEIDAVGHRAIHGASTFTGSVIIIKEVLDTMKDLIALAPLHNPPAILGVEACLENMPGMPMVGVFDTSFYQTLPQKTYMYGLPYEYYEKYSMRRYGFHGTSHRFVSRRVTELLGPGKKVITCHLGSGASITAIDDGRAVDTSMGFTPLQGLLMGTRCGDIDPAIVGILMEKENLTPAQVSDVMNKKSGLLGLSGVSSDFRYVEEAALAGNQRAALAIEVFYQSILRYIGSYIAELGGLDALVFTAGIGENSVSAREYLCRKLAYLGIELDEAANSLRGKEAEISKAGSKVRVFVIPTNEELMIARDTRDVLLGRL